jgi:hypothetical protein
VKAGQTENVLLLWNFKVLIWFSFDHTSDVLTYLRDERGCISSLQSIVLQPEGLWIPLCQRCIWWRYRRRTNAYNLWHHASHPDHVRLSLSFPWRNRYVRNRKCLFHNFMSYVLVYTAIRKQVDSIRTVWNYKYNLEEVLQERLWHYRDT